jgi:hypothetical protein
LISLLEYYEESLYPLQDGVLNTLNKCNVHFYLTGGTALSRAYYHHRYSDDLDFFTNNDDSYAEQVALVCAKLRDGGFLLDDEVIRSPTFTSFKVRRQKSDVALKLDFVNDIATHFGEIQSMGLYGRVDPIRNILSNKLGALFRFAAKDVADIREIALHESFNWSDMVSEAREKDAGVELTYLGEILGGIPEAEFGRIAWRAPAPAWEAFKADLLRIVSDMMNCGENSLRQR